MNEILLFGGKKKSKIYKRKLIKSLYFVKPISIYYILWIYQLTKIVVYIKFFVFFGKTILAKDIEIN